MFIQKMYRFPTKYGLIIEFTETMRTNHGRDEFIQEGYGLLYFWYIT